MTPRACDALTRQTTVLELLPDEEQEGLRIHKRASRVADERNNARFTGVPTPGSANPIGQGAGEGKVARMAKERPERKPEPEQPATTRVLPMQLQIGDRLPDEAGEWEVIGRPYTSNAGKIVHARVRRAVVVVERTWVKLTKHRGGGDLNPLLT